MDKEKTESPSPNKGGRPSHEPGTAERAYVERMAAIGVPEVDIAAVIGISAPTLRLHYRVELDLGLCKANVAVASNLFRQAVKDDPRSFQAAKFWLNCRAGWSEYAPGPPPSPRVEPLGKKDQQQQDADEIVEDKTGSAWARALN